MQLNVLDISIVDFFDVVLVAAFLYQVYRLLRNTMGLRIFYGVIVVFICWKAAQFLDMVLISEILGGIFSVGFVALVVVFQPELRRFLLTLGGRSFVGRFGKLFKKKQDSYMQIETIDAIVESCVKFSNDRIGAIIAIQVHEPVEEFISGGDFADILVTSSILGNIFPKTSSLHDGAVIVVGDRIVRTRAGLPISERKDIPSSVGFRHKAAIGFCDKTEAICIVVSEDTGYISYIRGRREMFVVNAKQLRAELIEDLHS
ncbi:MAG: diadenylate cyclase [Flavobacteriales bacterium Tduv]